MSSRTAKESVGRTIGSSIHSIASLSYLRCPKEEIHEFLRRNPPRRASDYSFIVRKCRLLILSCRGNLQLSQPLIMIATPHLQQFTRAFRIEDSISTGLRATTQSTRKLNPSSVAAKDPPAILQA